MKILDVEKKVATAVKRARRKSRSKEAADELERHRRINAEGDRDRREWERFVDGELLGRDVGPDVDVPDDWLLSPRAK